MVQSWAPIMDQTFSIYSSNILLNQLRSSILISTSSRNEDRGAGNCEKIERSGQRKWRVHHSFKFKEFRPWIHLTINRSWALEFLISTPIEHSLYDILIALTNVRLCSSFFFFWLLPINGILDETIISLLFFLIISFY